MDTDTEAGRGGPGPTGGLTRLPFTQGGMVYEKPRVERFGTFRDLTRAGWDRDNDGLVVFGIGGDNLCGGAGRPECPWGDGTITIGRS